DSAPRRLQLCRISNASHLAAPLGKQRAQVQRPLAWVQRQNASQADGHVLEKGVRNKRLGKRETVSQTGQERIENGHLAQCCPRRAAGWQGAGGLAQLTECPDRVVGNRVCDDRKLGAVLVARLRLV